MRVLADLWGDISPLLDEVLDLPSDAREPWLKDLETRAPELAAHVRSCLVGVAELADGKFLEAPIRSHLPTGLEGHTVGAYTLGYLPKSMWNRRSDMPDAFTSCPSKRWRNSRRVWAPIIR